MTQTSRSILWEDTYRLLEIEKISPDQQYFSKMKLKYAAGLKYLTLQAGNTKIYVY